MRYFNKRKSDLIREEAQTKRIQVQPKRPKPKQHTNQKHQVYPTQKKAQKKSPPPNYNEAIKTISSLQAGTSNGRSSQIESYRNFNGRTYAVVKTDGGTQLVRLPSISFSRFLMQMRLFSGTDTSTFSCIVQLSICLQQLLSSHVRAEASSLKLNNKLQGSRTHKHTEKVLHE